MSAYLHWIKRVKDTKTPWTEKEIIYYRKAIGHCGIKDIDRRENLRWYLEQGTEYRITGEQSLKGINYIRNVCFKKDGSLRQSKQNCFGLNEANIIRTFKEFRFVGLYEKGNLYYRNYYPIYRVYSKNGSFFDYTTDMGVMTVISSAPFSRGLRAV